MADITVGGANFGGVLTTTSTDAVAYAQQLVQQISNGLASGALTQFAYTSGSVAPEPASGFGGVATFSAPTNNAVFINGADQYVVVTAAGPVLLQGGAAGGTLVAGSGQPGAATNVIYTNITPTGDAVDSIAILGGNNLVQTATYGTGNYQVQSGGGNDTVNILRGNSTVNAGTGSNQINLGTGSNLIGSEGYDLITGTPYGTPSGTDTVMVGSGQASINSGGSSFLVMDSSPNPLQVTLGSGVDTVSLTGAGSATVTGVNSRALIVGNGVVVGTDTATGDYIYTSGGTTVSARAGAETISAGSGNNVLLAGTGNDTLTAGTGSDTLGGAIGAGATALLVSGHGAGTVFNFVAGQSGGSDTIAGLKGTDVLQFSGYGASPIATMGGSGANAVLTLKDGTTITVQGGVSTGQFRTS